MVCASVVNYPIVYIPPANKLIMKYDLPRDST